MYHFVEDVNKMTKNCLRDHHEKMCQLIYTQSHILYAYCIQDHNDNILDTNTRQNMPGKTRICSMLSRFQAILHDDSIETA